MTTLLTRNLPLLAGAPNGIKKLRELILELAVRGKLVPQDPNDEPASELLKRIAEEKARLVAEGKIKKQKPLAEIGEEETPFEVPTNWAWTRLGELGLVGSSSRVHQKDWQTSGIPFYRAREIVRLSKDGFVENELFISEALYQELSTGESAPKVGDIMLTGVGTIGVPYRVQKTDRFYFKDASVLIFKNHIADNSGYLIKYFVSPLWIEKIHAESMGTTVHTLTIARANETLCPLPPLAEQRRIVAKVDELMALCDRLEARQADADSAHAQLVQALLGSLTQARDAEDFAQNWQRLAEHFHTLFTTESSIDALKQTLLQLAVMGKLVPQDPGDELASELLKRIAEEKTSLVADGKLKKQKPLAEIDESEMSFELPLGWRWKRFVELALDVSTGPFGSLIHQSDYVDGGVPLVNPSHMIDGRIVADSSVSLSLEMAKSLDSYRLSAGDIVMARRGEVGRAALVTETEEGWLCGTGSFVLRFTSEISRAYVWILLRCHSVRTYLAGAAVGTTMVNLNHGILLKMPIAVPPIAEQHRIVAKVDQLMALCDQLKTRLGEARQVHGNLANALIGQALNGGRESRAEVVDFSAYLISKLASRRTFGRVAHMKLLFLADSHLGLGLMDGYRRHAAGPLDTTIYRVEERAAQEGLYSTSIEVLKSGQEKVSYHIGANISRSVETAASALGSAQKELDRLIALFEGRKTEDLEAVATLYAVWNDALAGGLHPNDEWLISEFRSNWHEAKERFAPDTLAKWLGWMRENGLVPTGNSAVTKSQAAFLFN
ncbi:type I restriction enzyme S subunit [Xanthomonas arboricola]|uniref:restriction endonuclease subunit S n=1 Tax=Xanthomonas TaxID=338 RepID=UPI000CEE917F|nr:MULTISPECIES: restriction endonuclease subunit S [Xanthomonas]MBB5735861.1 type I restriction enzyme S subunit [Xanthomonas sp. CFBP 8152]PPT81666.1 type I restriction endonuclease subunit S [Xanthomonas arboricola]